MTSRTLTRPQFKQACEAFIRRHEHDSTEFTERATRRWKWNQHPVLQDLGYLSREGHALRLSQSSTSTSPDEDLAFQNIEEYDGSTLHSLEPSPEILIVQQYVVYSPTFQVPAFYFTVHNRDGTIISFLDMIGTSLFRSQSFPDCATPAPHAILIPDSNFPLLSQGDHPVLGCPCWYFHPCETSAAVVELLEADDNVHEIQDDLLRWMEAWFLVLCSVVDLR